MSVFNEHDSEALQDMLDELRSMAEDLNVIGVSEDDDGNVVNYLDETEEGRRVSRILDNLQNFVEESRATLENTILVNDSNDSGELPSNEEVELETATA